MLDILRTIPAHDMGVDAYLNDIDRKIDKIDGEFLKLECRQEFQEPWEPSWNAMMEGDWPRALRLMEEARPGIREELAELPGMRRVRVVETPPSTYLEWELQLIRIGCGSF